jgi:hypothetical protein
MRKPSPATIIATVALFVALGPVWPPPATTSSPASSCVQYFACAHSAQPSHWSQNWSTRGPAGVSW